MSVRSNELNGRGKKMNGLVGWLDESLIRYIY